MRPCYRYRIHATHRQWIGKPDPADQGRFTVDVDDLDLARSRLEREGAQIDRIEHYPDAATLLGSPR